MPILIKLPSSPLTHDIGRRWLGTRYYWLSQTLGWGGILALSLAPIPFSADKLTPQGLAYHLALFALCAVGSHLLRVVFLYLLQLPRPMLGLVLMVFLWVLGIAAAVTFVAMSVNQMLAMSDASIAPESVNWNLADYVGGLLTIFILLTLWGVSYFLVRLYRQSQQDKLDQARFETVAREAELRALKSQLNPHFLFNSLNSLRALMPPEDEVSRATVSRLAGLLRSSLATDQERLVPLARELTLVESYLEIEKLRHQSRLRWIIEASLEARAWMMPPLLIQGLVENAIKHGINRLEQGGEIQIFAKVDESRLHLHVTNPGLLDTKSQSVGLGLVNARARLNLLFGPGSSLELHAAAENRVCARVCLPMPLSEVDPEIGPEVKL